MGHRGVSHTIGHRLQISAIAKEDCRVTVAGRVVGYLMMWKLGPFDPVLQAFVDGGGGREDKNRGSVPGDRVKQGPGRWVKVKVHRLLGLFPEIDKPVVPDVGMRTLRTDIPSALLRRMLTVATQ